MRLLLKLKMRTRKSRLLCFCNYSQFPISHSCPRRARWAARPRSTSQCVTQQDEVWNLRQSGWVAGGGQSGGQRLTHEYLTKGRFVEYYICIYVSCWPDSFWIIAFIFGVIMNGVMINDTSETKTYSTNIFIYYRSTFIESHPLKWFLQRYWFTSKNGYLIIGLFLHFFKQTFLAD